VSAGRNEHTARPAALRRLIVPIRLRGPVRCPVLAAAAAARTGTMWFCAGYYRCPAAITGTTSHRAGRSLPEPGPAWGSRAAS